MVHTQPSFIFGMVQLGWSCYAAMRWWNFRALCSRSAFWWIKAPGSLYHSTYSRTHLMKMKPLWVSALRHGFNLAVFRDKVDPCNIYISPGGKDGMLRGTWDVTLTSLCKQMYGQPTSLCIGFTQLPPNVLVLTAYSDFQLMHNESLGTCFCWLHTSGYICSVQYHFSWLQASLQYGGYKSESQYLSRKYDYVAIVVQVLHYIYIQISSLNSKPPRNIWVSPTAATHVSTFRASCEAPKFAAFCTSSFDGPGPCRQPSYSEAVQPRWQGGHIAWQYLQPGLVETSCWEAGWDAVCKCFGTGIPGASHHSSVF